MSAVSHSSTNAGGLLLGGFLKHRPRLTPELELRFQDEYYLRILPILRLVSLLLAGLVAAQTLHMGAMEIGMLDIADAFQLVFWLCVFGLTWIPRFGRIWQPVLMVLGWAIAFFVLVGLHGLLPGAGGSAGGGHPDAGMPQPSVPQQEFAFMLQMTVLMVTLSTLRLNFKWTSLLQIGVLLIGIWDVKTHMSPDPHPTRFVHFILLPGVTVLFALLLASFMQEWLARSTFWAAYLLEEERDVERREREQTAGQLRVLARAIGGIVHDLGGPMTVVQMGADLLAMRSESNPPEEVQEIQDAAQMLAALRTSLIEQTRVLEGKSIPVDLRPQSLRAIVEAGARFQNSRMKYKREISLVGEDQEIPADRMKLTTVFMNLIGNALKYSDGEVRVVWKVCDNILLIGVLDEGMAGMGISEAQANRLFVAFGRLETHEKVEGTGLGLISARKIVEAHRGEAFIEGCQNGSPASPHFSTAEGSYPSLLQPGFLTGFVVAIPSPSSLYLT